MRQVSISIMAIGTVILVFFSSGKSEVQVGACHHESTDKLRTLDELRPNGPMAIQPLDLPEATPEQQPQEEDPYWCQLSETRVTVEAHLNRELKREYDGHGPSYLLVRRLIPLGNDQYVAIVIMPDVGDDGYLEFVQVHNGFVTSHYIFASEYYSHPERVSPVHIDGAASNKEFVAVWISTRRSYRTFLIYELRADEVHEHLRVEFHSAANGYDFTVTDFDGDGNSDVFVFHGEIPSRVVAQYSWSPFLEVFEKVEN